MKSIHFVDKWLGCRVLSSMLADPRIVQARCVKPIDSCEMPISYEHLIMMASNRLIGAVRGKGTHLVLLCVFDDLRGEFRRMHALLHRVPSYAPSPSEQGLTPCIPTEVRTSTPLSHAT